MNPVITQVWDKLKNSKIFWAAVVGVVLFGGGYMLGLHHKVPVQIIEKKIEDVQSKQDLAEAQKTITALQEQLTVAQSDNAELKTHVKTVTHIVYMKDGTKTVDKTTESNIDKKTTDTTNTSKTTNTTTVATDDKKVDTDTKSHIDTEKITTPMLKDKYFLGVSGRVGLSGFSDPGIEFKYRLLDFGRISGWVGVELVIPAPVFQVQNISGRVGLGISF